MPSYAFMELADAQCRADIVASLPDEEAILAAMGWDEHFHLTAHDGQLPPEGQWLVWLVMGGRGFGKTRAGAEWVRHITSNDPLARIALVATSLGEARSVMVEGESGLIACSPDDAKPVFEPSLHRLRWPNGAQAFLYSATEPESLRGPQHSHAWCDEVGKWPQSHDRAITCWNNLLLGLRLGSDQRIVATTTPRNTPLLRRLMESEDTIVSGGATKANRLNLPSSFIDAMENEFGQSTLGRQELGGEMIEDLDGALWTHALIERYRERDVSVVHARVVVAVDPPASSSGDACGIIVAALGSDGIGRVLADCSIEKLKRMVSSQGCSRQVSNFAKRRLHNSPWKPALRSFTHPKLSGPDFQAAPSMPSPGLRQLI